MKNFLIANALYWVENFHVDGLRVDAVASMLYLDYGRSNGNWVPNQYGENKNLEAIEFFRHLNSVLTGHMTGAIMIAEESTAWPGVTKAPEEGGLGFTFKWNMGWMHDFLEYMKLDPYFRKFNHNKMTFGITYATSENYILTLSHDEVVHLKCSMINKMPGFPDHKFANLKAGYTFMMGHPGKKLLFMGQDFGQYHEWDEKTALDWYLAAEPQHRRNLLKNITATCSISTRNIRPFTGWTAIGTASSGSTPTTATGASSASSAGMKQGKRTSCSSSTSLPWPGTITGCGVPKSGTYTLILDNEHGLYKRGEHAFSKRSVKSECDGQPYSFAYPLPAYGTAVFRFN